MQHRRNSPTSLLLGFITLAFAGFATQAQAQAPALPPPGLGLAIPASPEAVPARIDGWKAAPSATRLTLASADSLIAQGKWKSAWDFLAAADKEWKNPFLLAKATELAIAGSIDNEGYLAFSFVDLPKGGTVAEARKAGTGSGAIIFSPLALAEAQSEAGIAAVPVLNLALGHYLTEVGRLFGGAWVMEDGEIAQRSYQAYASARGAGVYDPTSLRAEAEGMLDAGAVPNATALLVAAEGIDPKDPRTRYDHAVALLMQEQGELATVQVDAGLAFDKEPDSRLSGYGLGAQAASLSGNKARASDYLDRAGKEFPDRPEPYLFRHYIAVSGGDAVAASAIASATLDKFGASPNIISSLVTAWFRQGDATDAIAFLDIGLARFADDDQGAGAFAFYKAVALLQTAAAKEDLAPIGALLDQAEARLRKVLPAESEAFSTIASLRERLVGMLAGEPPAQQ
ncbi:MAG: hypothetical protein ACOYM2_11350 [Rectinemataceae bacterium]